MLSNQFPLDFFKDVIVNGRTKENEETLINMTVGSNNIDSNVHDYFKLFQNSIWKKCFMK